jgi:hypothetical protein
MTNPPLPPRRHKITLEEARALVRQGARGRAVRGGHFPREVFEAILAQPNCSGIRFYYGTNTDGSPSIVLVGIDENNADMTAGELIDTHYPCPPFCDDNTALR